jgi:hypothetical protein
MHLAEELMGSCAPPQCGSMLRKAEAKLSDLRGSETAKKAEIAMADLRQREPVKKAEEGARKVLNDLSSGGKSGDHS